MDRGEFGNVRMGDLLPPRINLSGRVLRLIPAVILGLMLLYPLISEPGPHFKLSAQIQTIVPVLPHG